MLHHLTSVQENEVGTKTPTTMTTDETNCKSKRVQVGVSNTCLFSFCFYYDYEIFVIYDVIHPKLFQIF